jgi:hypothetical protein
MHLEIVSTKSENLYILEGFQQSIIPYINVYNQVYFTLKKPLSIVQKLRKETNHEFGFNFPIDGELKGKAIALIDIFNKELCEDAKKDVINAAQEGLNILIGKTLSSLDNNIDLMSLIAPPNIIKSDDNFVIREKFHLKVNLTYSIEFKNIMYDCRIYFLLNKKVLKEINV